jgi:hypothetical protein
MDDEMQLESDYPIIILSVQSEDNNMYLSCGYVVQSHLT